MRISFRPLRERLGPPSSVSMVAWLSKGPQSAQFRGQPAIAPPRCPRPKVKGLSRTLSNCEVHGCLVNAKHIVAKNHRLNMRTLSATLPHESFFFGNPKSFRAQNEPYFATGHRTRSRPPRASALAVCADESPASVKKWGDTPNFSWRLREFNDLRRGPVVFAKGSRFFASSHFDARKAGKSACVTMCRRSPPSRQVFMATLRQHGDFKS
jgi:hypothetical protein